MLGHSSSTGEPLLDRVLHRFAELQAKKPKALLPKVGKEITPAVHARLESRGMLRREDSTVVGR